MKHKPAEAHIAADVTTGKAAGMIRAVLFATASADTAIGDVHLVERGNIHWYTHGRDGDAPFTEEAFQVQLTASLAATLKRCLAFHKSAPADQRQQLRAMLRHCADDADYAVLGELVSGQLAQLKEDIDAFDATVDDGDVVIEATPPAAGAAGDIKQRKVTSCCQAA